MTPVEFIHFYGLEKFKRNWPRLRTLLPLFSIQFSGVYNLAWSRLSGGGWNLQPTPDFFDMPARRRDFLLQVSRLPGRSIYEIAQALNMQYRRAHDHAVGLARVGKIKTVEGKLGERRKLRLFPIHQVQATD